MRLQIHSPAHDRFSEWQLDELFRFRNRYFNEIRGWNLPLDHGREIDRFDCDPAIHVAAVEEDGTLVGCFRLLPTERPHLLDTHFPALMGEHPVLRGPDVWEISRLAVIPRMKRRVFRAETMRITAHLLKTLFEVCDDLEIGALTCVTDTQFERLLHIGGFECRRFGDALQIGVESCVAGSLTVNWHNRNAAERMTVLWERRRPVVPGRMMTGERPAIAG
ncbi:acyl-homoserine-lactone synthase [Oceanibaculum pacificum]|uniref:Acyl-homoserine-lactone synthase n=1 Tax=Oceanibaculum pacificum TaxID=580166 RepID=A0A154W4F4_9PROT|nr:acyl-homoserine-lactone synthase [Oceanibaculum pacificum]KZD08337.1 hypothetical protein AUP43_01670 [Oceanibaculum pacificum]